MSGGWGTPAWMKGDPQEGETLINGKDAATARRLLAAARSLDLDPSVVRTVNGGFIVPDAVWDAMQETLVAETGGEF